MNSVPVDERVNSPEKIEAPFPLPHISRRALRRVSHPLPVPTECPYCSSSIELISNSVIYGREFGEWPYAYSCQVCDAYVGLHPHTDLPLGSLADSALREARKEGKAIFYRMVDEMCNGRSEGYEWLAGQMKLDPSDCHWGMFTEEQCDNAAEICQRALNVGDFHE